jgi:hypothetical protein
LEAALAAFQLNEVLQAVVPEAAKPVGVEGTVVQLLQVPTTVQGWPLPAGPLFVAGFCPWVHQLFL